MKLLVAIDGSEQSLRALDKAVDLSRKLAQPAAITLTNVHNDAFVRRHQHLVGKQAVDQYLAETHAPELRDATARLDGLGMHYDVMHASGELAPTITHQAESGGFDMIVMGAKGRNALTDLVLGSVVTRVLAISKVPVLVVT